MFAILIESQIRDLLLERLRNFGVQATSHYQPLHNSIAGKKYGKTFSAENSIKYSQKICRLPLWAGMEPDLIKYIVQQVNFIVGGL